MFDREGQAAEVLHAGDGSAPRESAAKVHKYELTAAADVSDASHESDRLRLERELSEQPGVTLDITINNHHLIANTLARLAQLDIDALVSSEYKEDLRSFQNYARGISERCYNFLILGFAPEGYFVSPSEFFATGSLDELAHFFDTVEQSPEFNKIRQQTEAYITHLREEWGRNYTFTSAAIQEMTGLSLDKGIKVLITHPGLPMGMYLGDNTIQFGGDNEKTRRWNNYSTVYLWHEILHSYPELQGPDTRLVTVDHALIQLITDNELRVRLNGGSYPPYEGHEAIFPLMDIILPYWHEYLEERANGGSRSISDLYQMLNTLPEVREWLQKNDENLNG